MGEVKAGFKVVGGQVPIEIRDYLRAFAKAKGSTVSKQVGIILEDWYRHRGAFSDVDKAAHAVAEEQLHYGPDVRDPPKGRPSGTKKNGTEG